MVLVVALHALFGLSLILTKKLVTYAGPFFTTGLRMTTAGVFLVSYILFTKNNTQHPRWSDWLYYAQYSVIGIFLSYVLRLYAQAYMPSVKTSFLLSLSPFFTAIMSYFVNNERISPLQTLGLLIGFGGTLPVLLQNPEIEQLASGLGGYAFLSLPEIAAIASIALFSYALLVIQKLVRERGCPPYIANGVCMLTGGILAFNSSLFLESTLLYSTAPRDLLMLAGVLMLQVVLSNIVCANLRAHLLTIYSATFMAFSQFLTPIFTGIYGYFIFGEHISLSLLYSFVIVFFGLSLYHYGDRYLRKIFAA